MRVEPTDLWVPRPSMRNSLWQGALCWGFRLARVWWRLRRRPHQGALVAIHVGSSLLVVRSSYRREWNFPGGGLHRNEAPEDAAKRELWEEIGLRTPALTPAGIVSGIWDGRPDRVHMFELRLRDAPALRLDGREIIGARLVTPIELKTMLVTGPVMQYLGQKEALRPAQI